ncbi:hypothetical protein AVEN_5252-1 [Araneus ventricosus]|uniref:Uncharacterized protein n=1 Tax=Araneus ventricosus TaxID=182803 RepID=A0A4Y2MJK6_ARAVE|nr:hypothetical protein AVEN_5252-1 [Araneus ventricosus]
MSKLIFLRIASHPSTPSAAPDPGLRWSSRPKKILNWSDRASLGEGPRWFKKLGSPFCVCGLVGDADHYVFRYPLIAEFHLKEPSDEHRKSWFKNLRCNGQAQSTLIQAFKISNGVFDRLTKG